MAKLWGFGFIALTLIGGYFLMRIILRRLEESSKFTESLAQSAISSMQEIVRDSTAAQREVAMTLRNMTEQLESSRTDHAKLANGQKEILRGLKGGLGRDLGG